MGQKYGYFIKQCDIVPRAALRTRSQVIVAVSSQSEGGIEMILASLCKVEILFTNIVLPDLFLLRHNHLFDYIVLQSVNRQTDTSFGMM